MKKPDRRNLTGPNVRKYGEGRYVESMHRSASCSASYAKVTSLPFPRWTAVPWGWNRRMVAYRPPNRSPAPRGI
ncbi:hypothetical protein X977_3294 [Burkholderia pseudomallei MSHR7504]|nr:hypothetical protein X977_3294 [Burkholderia pseudomallei MSHR7504]